MSKIIVDGLGKAFKTYKRKSDKLLDWIFPGKPKHKLIWALSDISFEISGGEAVGVVGLNGAGKSTLLKILAGTMHPTCGTVKATGRVAALLELGMGFHPEFSGRQNAIMGAQLQGYTSQDINKLMPAIEEFAEIGEYIDQPLRTYSSGMHMRLAFSVATARRPDVLIVDEALSVGDSYFQHKSFDRIRKFRESGTTLLIVSHSPASILAVCDRAIMLDEGCLVKEGRPDEVLDYYNAALADRTRALIRMDRQTDGSVRTVSGTGEAYVKSAHLLHDGVPIDMIDVGQEVRLQVRVEIAANVNSLVIGFLVKDNVGQFVYGINTYRLGKVLRNLKKGEEIIYEFSFVARLGKGNYSVSISLSREDSHVDGNYEWMDRAVIFHVINTDKEDFVGCNWLGAEVSINGDGQQMSIDEHGQTYVDK